MQQHEMSEITQRTTPVQARSVQRVEKILTTAADLISEVGVDAASTSAIARRAGISLASLYRYFPNKTAILAAIAERHIARLDKVYDEFLADMDLDAGLDRLIDALAEFYRTEPGYMEIWSGVQAIPELLEMDREDFERQAGRIAEEARKIVPDIPQEQLRPMVVMLSRTIGSLVRQAMIMDRETADAMLGESKFMVKQYIEARLESLQGTPH